MKQFLFIIITIFGLQNQCLAAEDDLQPGNGVVAPILIDVIGGEIYRDDAPMGPHRNQVSTPNIENPLSVFGSLIQPDETLLNITCGTLNGKGLIEGDNLSINSHNWDFFGTIFCSHVCTINTTADIDTLRLNTNFVGGGSIIIKVDAGGHVIDEQAFNAHHLIIPAN